MKVWTTKYALTSGVQEVDAELFSEGRSVRHSQNGFTCFLHGEGVEWCRTLEAALERADVMRENRLQSLRKQIEKLEKLKIKVKK